MKTRSNTTGNNNNRVLNGLLRTAVVLVSVVLFSFTTSAQNLLNELLSYNSPVEITSVPVSSENPGTANFEAFNIVEDAEADLAVESWMTNSNYFNASSLYTTVDREASLEIENWMVDSDFYTSPYASEEEQELALEAWMCDSQFFNN